MPASFHRSRRIRVERGEYITEVLQGNNGAEPFWYYVLQRKDSSDILHLAKYDSFDEAIEAAKCVLRQNGALSFG